MQVTGTVSVVNVNGVTISGVNVSAGNVNGRKARVWTYLVWM